MQKQIKIFVSGRELKFDTHIMDHQFEGQGHRSKVKVPNVKNTKILIFSLVSETVVQGQPSDLDL